MLLNRDLKDWIFSKSVTDLLNLTNYFSSNQYVMILKSAEYLSGIYIGVMGNIRVTMTIVEF
jgi:hypothetical protein